MDSLIQLIDHNGLWIMVIAVVGIGSWFKYRERELKIPQELRNREMDHAQKMKQLELDIERAKQTATKT